MRTYDIIFHTTFVFVIIELGWDRSVHLGVTKHPADPWTAQQLREVAASGEGPRLLIHDSDSKDGKSFACVASDIEVLKTPGRAPRAHAA